MRRLFRLLLVLVVIVGILVIAGRLYLRSAHVKEQVMARLQAAYGGPVHIDEVDVGLSSSSASGVKLYENGKDTSPQPWISAESVQADVSVLSLLEGSSTPHNLTLTGVAITLRFDGKGHVETTLPARPATGATTVGTLPNLRIERGQITLVREGSAALVIPNIDADLRRQGDNFVLNGTTTTAEGQGWGKWTLRGSFRPSDEQMTVSLTTDQPLHITQAMLNELPFVPATVWQEVQVDGITPVAITLHYDVKDNAVHYRVDMHPTQTTVKVPAIDLEATNSSGEVIIADSVVTLRDVKGQVLGGTIQTDATLNFTGPADDLKFNKVVVRGLDMRRLPKSWGLPTQIEGQLKGSAWLEVVLGKGKPQTRGEGKGEIENARVAGQPTAEPVQLELHARDGGFGFRSKGSTSRGPQAPNSAERLALVLLAADLTLLQAPPPHEADLLGGAANQAAATLERVVQRTIEVGTAALEALPRKLELPQRRPQEPNRYVSVNLKMRNVDLTLFARGLGLTLPFPVGGRLTFQVKADVPIDTSGDLKTYRVNGKATVTDFTLADLKLGAIDADINYLNGILRLDRATARIAAPAAAGEPALPGILQGRARVQLVPLGELAADLTARDLPLNQLGPLLGEADALQGRVSGAVTARVPVSRLKAPDAWEATADVAARQLVVFGLTLRDSAADLRVKNGVASLTRVRTSLEGAPLTGAATVRLASPYPLKGNATLVRWNLAALQRLAPRIRPPVPIEGSFDTTVQFQGTMQPFRVQTSGTADASALRMAGVQFKNGHVRWSSDAERVTLKDVRAVLYGGEVTGSAAVPLRAPAEGEVDLQVRDLDVGALARDVPAFPGKIAGKASGALKGTIITAAGKPPQVTMNLNLKSPQLRVQGIATEQLQGTVGYHQGILDYQLEGKALGGTFELNGQLPPAAKPAAKPGKEGRLQLRGGKLSLLAGAFGQSAGTFPLRGRVDLDVRFRNEGGGFAPVGGGTLVLTDVAWGNTPVTDRLQARLTLTGQELRVSNLSAIVWDGLLRLQLTWNLRQPERSWVTLSLDRGEVSRLLAPWPDLARLFQGSLDVRLRGRLGREWHGSADVFVARGKLGGVEVTEWRLPFLWSYALSSGRGELSLDDSSAQLARGRATGRAKATWGTGLRLEGQIRFANLDLRTLSGQFSDSSQYVSGRVTGQFDLQETEVRSVNDLRGTLRATLGDTQALQTPGLQQIAPFVGLSASTTFQNGELVARLSGGAFRLERLALQSDLARLFVEGNVTLAGRLNLDVTARTGPIGVDFGTLRLLGVRVPLTGNIPLSVIAAASSYLSNRVVHLHVSGTLRSPSIQIETGTLLTQEAVRFFLNRTNLPLP